MKQISSSQAGFMMPAFIGGSGFMIAFLGRSLGHNRWLVFLVLLPLVLLLAWFFHYLINSLPKDGSFFDKIQSVCGKKVGKIFFFFYLLQFLFLLSINAGFLVWFWHETSLTGTPAFLLIALPLLLSCYASYLGQRVLARLGAVLCVILIIATGIDSLFLYSSIDLQNFLPVAGFQWPDLWASSFAIFALAFTDMSVLFSFSITGEGKNKAGKWIFLSVFLSFVYLFFLELRNTAVLGEGISFYSYPLLQSLSLMQIGDFMGRFEVIGINGFIAFSLYKVMMLFFALCTTGNHIFPQVQHHKILIACFIVAVATSVFSFQLFHAFQPEWLLYYLPFALLLCFVCPSIILFQNKRKSKNNKR